MVHPQPGRADRPVRRADAGRPRRVRRNAGQQQPGHRFPGGDRLGRPARRGAERDGNAGHAAGRGRDPRSERRRRDQQHRQRRQQPDLRPVPDRHPDRPRGQRRAQRHRPDPRQSARRHPRAAGHPRRHRRRPDPLRRRRDHRHEPRGAELVRRQYDRQAPARRFPAWPRSTAPAESTATIRVILDPAALQAQGITAAQVNQQLRQSNINAAGGRAEIAGSEQSVRVLGNATDAYQLSQTQIALPGGRFVKLADLGQVKDSYSEQRTLAKQDGRQVVSFEVQRAKGASEVTHLRRRLGRAAEDREGKSEGPLHSEIFNTVDYTKAQYKSAMEGADRRRHPRGPRRPPVPARHPRHRHLGAGDPAVGDPGLLVHEPDGDHPERPVAAGDEPGRRRAGRRRDRRDREHRPAHAHGQIGLSGVARRRRRDRPRGARDDHVDRRRVPAGRA